jgi:hypothetical protein
LERLRWTPGHHSAGEDLVEPRVTLFDAVLHAARHCRVACLDGRERRKSPEIA